MCASSSITTMDGCRAIIASTSNSSKTVLRYSIRLRGISSEPSIKVSVSMRPCGSTDGNPGNCHLRELAAPCEFIESQIGVSVEVDRANAPVFVLPESNAVINTTITKRVALVPCLETSLFISWFDRVRFPRCEAMATEFTYSSEEVSTWTPLADIPDMHRRECSPNRALRAGWRSACKR